MSGGRLRWVLLVSLGLNVALGTALLLPWAMPAHFHHARHHAPGHGGDHLPSPRHMRRVLGPQRAADVEAVMERHRPAIRATFGPLREARQHAHAVLQSDPFDPEALQQAFAELRARDAETAAAVQAMLAEVAATLSAEERRRLAKSFPERR